MPKPGLWSAPRTTPSTRPNPPSVKPTDARPEQPAVLPSAGKEKRPHDSAGVRLAFAALGIYERAAAAAFLAAFTAVAALRRRLVLGGVAGASPINSAVMMLVTNNFGP